MRRISTALRIPEDQLAEIDRRRAAYRLTRTDYLIRRALDLDLGVAPITKRAPKMLGRGRWREVLLNDPCAYCGTKPSVEIDHIVPHRAGGEDAYTNLVGACRACNRRKRSRSLLSILSGQEIGSNPELHEHGVHYNQNQRGQLRFAT